MRFDFPLIEARLIRRYQRFLADVEFADGNRVVAHTPNTGSMLGCNEKGARIWLRNTHDDKRKYPFAWELVEVTGGVLVGINTLLANRLVQEAIENLQIPELSGYPVIRKEVPYGKERSRIDFLLESDSKPPCYLEVKNVTLAADGRALFPDAVTVRGSKHLRELSDMAGQGNRAVIFYCVQRSDVTAFSPADFIDPKYGVALRDAISAGVEVLAYRADVSTTAIELNTSLQVIIPR